MKKVILFFITFIICAIVITVTMIKIDNYKQNSIIVSNQNGVQQDEILTESDINNNDVNKGKNRGIDIYGTYNENDLLINEIKEKFNGKEISMPRIEGLKNKQVENKINEDVRKRVHEYILQNESEEYGFEIKANFGNVISIVYAYKYNSYDQMYVAVGNGLNLNYNLKNGERLRYEELFVSDADALNVSRNIIYESKMELDRGWYLYSYDFEYNNATEGEIENLIQDLGEDLIFDENYLMKTVNSFMKEDEKEFYFTPDLITVMHDRPYWIYMDDYHSEIGIYTNFSTSESIFVNDNIGRKDLWTMSKNNPLDFEAFKKAHPELEEFSCGLLENNLWYDNIICTNYYDFVYPIEVVEQNYQKVIQDEKNNQENMLKTYQELAKENEDKFYVILNYVSIVKDEIYNPDIYIEDFSDFNIVNKNLFIYEMPKDLYEEKYKRNVYSLHRNFLALPLYSDISEFIPIEIDEKDDIVFERKEEEYLIKLENSTIVSKLEDLTNDYEGICNIVRKELSKNYYHLDPSQIENYIENAEFKFEIPSWGLMYYLTVSSENYEDEIQLESDDLKEFLLIMEVEKK